MRHAIRQPGCRIMAVDNSPDMLQRCRSIIETDTHETPVELHCANLQDVAVANASVVSSQLHLAVRPPGPAR